MYSTCRAVTSTINKNLDTTNRFCVICMHKVTKLNIQQEGIFHTKWLILTKDEIIMQCYAWVAEQM